MAGPFRAPAGPCATRTGAEGGGAAPALLPTVAERSRWRARLGQGGDFRRRLPVCPWRGCRRAGRIVASAGDHRINP